MRYDAAVIKSAPSPRVLRPHRSVDSTRPRFLIEKISRQTFSSTATRAALNAFTKVSIKRSYCVSEQLHSRQTADIT